jgi:glycyl-tRNA synthetase beta chain
MAARCPQAARLRKVDPMPDVLIELLSEEIPARMQARAADDLKRLVTDALVEAGLTYAHAKAFATPRRLALAIEGLSPHSPDQTEERKGPRTDAPAAAIEGFLRATGLTLDQLEIRADKKAQVYFARLARPGCAAPAILAEVLESVVRNFPWPKSMRWGAGSLRWVRPLRSILCVLSTEAGAEVVPLSIDGIEAGATTRGHRFMAPEPFTVTSFEEYTTRLKRAFVLLDPAERAARIEAEISAQAFALGLELVPDPALLAEVTGLVEWPVVLVGRIEERFLSLPPEVLQTSMREHQKFFSLRDPATGQIVRFVTVANTETRDGGALVLAGNQKVLAARLSDAMFFWENDNRFVRQAGMEAWTEALGNVTFHNKLGSQKDRISRIEALAREIAPMVGADPDTAAQAARVAKADLRSAMVGEFPELQGTMGSYYARAAGLPEEVAQACREHYQPLGPSDSVPTNPVSVAVALADKIDTLTGFWAIDEKPTGSKDPFALRRAALGVIRLVLGNEVRLSVLPSMTAHINRMDARTPAPFFDGACEETTTDLLSFLHDRLKVFLRDQGIRHDVIDACLSLGSGAPSGATPGNDDLTLLVNRATALAATLKTDDGTNLIQGFKRANNILTQAEQKDGVEYSFGPDPALAETPEETALFNALDAAEATISPALKAEDFTTAMAAMAALRGPIDAFFTATQINTDNAILRRNRLNLLHRIRATCARVADLSRIEG